MSTATATPRTKLSPPEVATRFGVNSDKVLAWIRSGELRAIDVSSQPGIGRPRYRVDLCDLAAFESGRQVVVAPKTTRRRRKDPDVIEFF